MGEHTISFRSREASQDGACTAQKVENGEGIAPQSIENLENTATAIGRNPGQKPRCFAEPFRGLADIPACTTGDHVQNARQFFGLESDHFGQFPQDVERSSWGKGDRGCVT